MVLAQIASLKNKLPFRVKLRAGSEYYLALRVMTMTKAVTFQPISTYSVLFLYSLTSLRF